jgi:hypothetical protein
MDWQVIAAMTLLVGAIIVGLVIVLYTSVSRFARNLVEPGAGAGGGAGGGAGAFAPQPHAAMHSAPPARR